jgi:hypothetical protein
VIGSLTVKLAYDDAGAPVLTTAGRSRSVLPTPVIDQRNDSLGRILSPKTISSSVGRFSSGSMALKSGSPPVPGPTRATRAPRTDSGSPSPANASHR